MSMNRYADRTSCLGLLPEPERSPESFFASMVINGTLLAFLIYVGATARHVVELRQYEQTILIIPSAEEPPPPPKVKLPEPPKVDPPKLPDMKLDAPKIKMPAPEPKPDPKPILMESKVNAPIIKTIKPTIVEAPQPKAALASQPMPAQVPQTKVSTVAVHFGQTFGVTPNPNAKGPATIAAIGNPYGGMNGAAIAPHGVVGGTGIGNGIKPIPNSGNLGKVASAGIPGASNATPGTTGKVASAGIPGMFVAEPTARVTGIVASTNLEVISKPPVQYTAEAKQLKVQGDVVLRCTFTASGQVVIESVVHSLGHGLDEEARRVAQQIRFRPATRNGQAVDMTTNIIISFQLA